MLARVEGSLGGPRVRCSRAPVHAPVTQWILTARTRQARYHVVSAVIASKAAAVAAAALASPATASTSEPYSAQLQRYQSSFQAVQDWDYKYQHFPCASPVDPADVRCMQIEALFQHVLGYPRLPPRVHRYLGLSTVTVEAVTATLEGLNAKYGREMVLYLVRRNPHIMEYGVEEMTERAEAARSMLDLKPHDIFTMLRKNPLLLVIETAEARARFNKLHRVTPLSHEAVKVMVRKYPLVLNCSTETIAAKTEKLRHLAYTRAMWQQDFDCISPSLLAFFLRDYRDLLLRLEYLAITGNSPTLTLHQVFKPSNNLFAKKHRGFREWLRMRAERRQQLMRRAQMAVSRRTAAFQAQGVEDGGNGHAVSQPW